MPETDKQHSSENAKTVLENLKNLRFFEGDEADFWNSLLYNTSILCKSPVVLVISTGKNEWRIQREYYTNQTIQAEKESLLSSVRELLERAYKNGFAYERLNLSLPGISHPFSIVNSLDGVQDDEKCFLLVIIDKINTQQFNDMVVRTQLTGDIPLGYYKRKENARFETEEKGNQFLVSILGVVSTVMSKDRFLLACMTFVNEIAD